MEDKWIGISKQVRQRRSPLVNSDGLVRNKDGVVIAIDEIETTVEYVSQFALDRESGQIGKKDIVKEIKKEVKREPKKVLIKETKVDAPHTDKTS